MSCVYRPSHAAHCKRTNGGTNIYIFFVVSDSQKSFVTLELIVMGPNCIDDIDCGSFFDHIDDFIDFLPENKAPFGSGSVTDFCYNFLTIWTGAADDLPGSDPLFPVDNTNSASDLSVELAVPVCYVSHSFSQFSKQLNF